jgi:uncharacterized membrane protein
MLLYIIKGMRKAVILSLALILAQFFLGFYLYPSLPDRIAVHWGVSGEADGYGSKFMGLFMLPLVTLLLLPMMHLLPRIDPAKGIEKFQEGYDWFVFGFVAFMSTIHELGILWNLGHRFDMTRIITPAIGALFFGIGYLMDKIKFNWFVGIRTPWTLSNEEVWEKTHRIGGKVFKACGLLAVLGILFEGVYALVLILAPILVATLYLTYYSYSEYQKLNTIQVK